jgi:hypothetical protein
MQIAAAFAGRDGDGAPGEGSSVASWRDHPWQLDRELRETRLALEQRIEKLEATVKPPESGSRFMKFVRWMGPALPTLIGSAVLLILGYMVKDSVDQSIRRQQLQMSFAKDAQEHLKVMATRETPITQVEQAAVSVATYGPSSTLLLVNEMRKGGNRAVGAEAGLQMVAIMDPEPVCRILERVLANRAKLLGWEEHMRLTRVLGVGDCREAAPMLRDHERAVAAAIAGNADDVKALVPNVPDSEQMEEWQAAIRNTLTLLRASRRKEG